MPTSQNLQILGSSHGVPWDRLQASSWTNVCLKWLKMRCCILNDCMLSTLKCLIWGYIGLKISLFTGITGLFLNQNLQKKSQHTHQILKHPSRVLPILAFMPSVLRIDPGSTATHYTHFSLDNNDVYESVCVCLLDNTQWKDKQVSTSK